MQEILKAGDIFKTYGTVDVLKGIDFSVQQGEVVSIVGASGAGKSTLLHILGSLDRPDTGWVKIKDEEISAMNDKTLSAFRNQHIGFIFQFHNLLPEFTAVENVLLPAMIGKRNLKEAENRAKDLLRFLGLDHRFTHYPNQLSGGEQQRVAVARSLINDPLIVFADEPSGNLDTHNAEELHQLFFDLRKTYNQTFVIVTHNEKLADLSDRKVVMQDGVII
ncbi:ABC transporter ATP-binding protein [Cytophaga hutchinsonii]|uniref:Lipoprotein-releasing system ATP-binding protein LolD n=1 Tax=Cytophaga hutchinsonii (strain ATCC 33406 / DSM 1761 / CIP 103989 / NBRC 15051 / NCIMB 9469 / D465) TaxID=269798 RepID=LOLD_CYTH3|nr:ABC transporter ATP-binding protein [Cytophaga hutchinsonii]Q11SW8.2 RecName: Full=Lipoprotein-releasing system ATP-binding protein LolD [Cytophaga hutchinsonii ATCC 33406]SFX94162.1 lipoprotein-releasing system ATP-binding protein [Cytophaga hutchinsonii ATCC 33406]